MTPTYAVASSRRKSIRNSVKVFYLPEELLGVYIYGSDGTLNVCFFTKQENYFTTFFCCLRVCGGGEVLLVHFVEDAMAL